MTRIDLEVMKRGLFETRSKAQYAINNGCVLCNGNIIIKCSYDVKNEDKITVTNSVLPFVSKEGLKLEKALNDFNIILKHKKCWILVHQQEDLRSVH